MIFLYPWSCLWLLLFIPLILLAFYQCHLKGEIQFSSLKNLKQLQTLEARKGQYLLLGLRLAAVCLFVIALMRPQWGLKETKIEKEGIDIMLAVDVSGSMMAEDFVLNGERKNRLDVVKSVVHDFILKRTNDRIGLVIFAGRAYMQCPPTLDYGILLQYLDRTRIGMLEDGTAVGDGIATALTSLRRISGKSKVIILLTDGVNNAGKVEPQNAAELAKALKVKIYTIGAGSKGRVPYPVQDMFGNKVYQWAQIDLDDASLSQIAQATGGQYFRATDTEGLRKIYDEINRLEKTKVEMNQYREYRELFVPLAFLGLCLILVEIVLRNTRLRTLP